MKIKEYLIAIGISTTVSLVVVFILWLMSVISWAIVWATLSFGFIPVAIKAMNFYQEHDCYDIDDFINALMEYRGESKEQDSSKENKIEW